MLRYRSGRGLPGTPGSPGGLAVDRTRGRGGESSRRAESQESSGPTVARGLGRKPGFSHGRRVNGLSGGARLRSGRNGREAGEPEGNRSAVEVDARGDSRGGQAVSTIAGKSRPAPGVASRRGPSGGSGGAARRRRAAESDRKNRSLRAGRTVEAEPAGKQKAAGRRHGSSRGEGSEGRTPRTSAAWNKAAQFRGKRRLERVRATGSERGDAAESAGGLKKPVGGTGEGVATFASHDRSRRSR